MSSINHRVFRVSQSCMQRSWAHSRRTHVIPIAYCQSVSIRQLQEQHEAACNSFIGPDGIQRAVLQLMVRQWTAGGISRCNWSLNPIALAGRPALRSMRQQCAKH